VFNCQGHRNGHSIHIDSSSSTVTTVDDSRWWAVDVYAVTISVTLTVEHMTFKTWTVCGMTDRNICASFVLIPSGAVAFTGFVWPLLAFPWPLNQWPQYRVDLLMITWGQCHSFTRYEGEKRTHRYRRTQTAWLLNPSHTWCPSR